MTAQEKVFQHLHQFNIEYTLHSHQAAFTVEEAQKYCSHIPGLHCKNLFLRDHKGKRHFLLVLPNTKPVDLKLFNSLLNDRLSFGSSKRMFKYLGVEPGSVSPFGLINDEHSKVLLYIDQEVYEAELVTFHPNDNSATLELTKENFHLYLSSINNSIQILQF